VADPCVQFTAAARILRMLITVAHKVFNHNPFFSPSAGASSSTKGNYSRKPPPPLHPQAKVTGALTPTHPELIEAGSGPERR
jgi:hypothetical protein